MKAKVWIIEQNGNVQEELFDADQEASNHAKAQSGRGHVNCAIFRTANSKVFFYENGQVVDARRKQELVKTTEEMLLHKFSREVNSINKGKRKK